MMNDSNDNWASYDNEYAPRSGFTTAAFLFGFLTLFTLPTGVFAIPCGALAVLFAYFASRKGKKMYFSAKFGLAVGLFGIFGGLYLTVTSMQMVLRDPTLLRQSLALYREIYGEDALQDVPFFEQFLEEDSAPDFSQDATPVVPQPGIEVPIPGYDMPVPGNGATPSGGFSL